MSRRACETCGRPNSKGLPCSRPTCPYRALPPKRLHNVLHELGYSAVFNAIAAATHLEWGGTAIGISVQKFIEALPDVEVK